uniref:Uncharacterized protein n=1 Tax=Heliothis virescens TaxID=7102 RepID=A0A2A4JP66_HELVI
MKSSLVKNKRSGKTSKGKCGKKRVRFSDSEPVPKAGITLCERFVRFFNFLAKYTRGSVKNVIRSIIVEAECTRTSNSQLNYNSQYIRYQLNFNEMFELLNYKMPYSSAELINNLGRSAIQLYWSKFCSLRQSWNS